LGGGGYTPLNKDAQIGGYKDVTVASDLRTMANVDDDNDGVEEVRLCLASGKFTVK